MNHNLKPPASRLSLWLTRMQAIGFGFLFLLLIELTCRFFGFGHQSQSADPFVGFSAQEPLFALNPLTNHYDLRPERRLYFVSDGFPRFKDPKTFRIFVLGGSTVQGRPYSIQTAFPQWLQINLELAYPGGKFEAVNCGGISYASYRLVPVIEECLEYEPDLFILCTGQNEFLEARTYGPLKEIAKHLGGPVKTLRDLATYRAMDTAYHRYLAREMDFQTPKKPTMKMEVDALLDYRRGLQAYHRDPDWRAGVIAHFEENIRRIQAICKKNGVPLMILNPPVNLKNCPPFKSEPSAEFSSEQKVIHKEILLQYVDLKQLHPGPAAHYLVTAREALDPHHAASQYTLGHAYLHLGDVANAATCFEIALEEDICPLRILPGMRRFLHAYSHKHKIPYLDLQSLLLQHSDSPILGSGMLVDHIHPSIRGHQIIGEAIASLLMDQRFGKPEDADWQSKRKQAYAVQTASLDALYYAHGQTRLNNLMAWTQGMTEGPPIEMHVPIEN